MITGKVNQLCLEASFELIQHARGLVQHHVDTTWNQIQYKLIPSLTGWWSVHRWHGREVEWLLFHISTTTVFHLMFNVVQGTDFAGFQLTHLMCKGTRVFWQLWSSEKHQSVDIKRIIWSSVYHEFYNYSNSHLSWSPQTTNISPHYRCISTNWCLPCWNIEDTSKYHALDHARFNLNGRHKQ